MSLWVEILVAFVPVLLLLVSGVGWLVRALVTNKDSQIDRLVAESEKSDHEAEVATQKYVSEKDVHTETRLELRLLQEQHKNCEKERDRLREQVEKCRELLEQARGRSQG